MDITELEIKKDTRYILKLAKGTPHDQAKFLSEMLTKGGFDNVMIVVGDFELFEVKK